MAIFGDGQSEQVTWPGPERRPSVTARMLLWQKLQQASRGQIPFLSSYGRFWSSRT